MMKQSLLSLLMLLSATFACAGSFTYNYRGIEFRCSESKGVVTIVGFDHDATKVLIPATVVNKKGNEYPVKGIDFYSANRYKTTEVAIEKGIKEIAPRCFSSFTNLNLVYIPNTVEIIGKNAFNKKHMPNFKMPSSISEPALRSGAAVYPKVEEVDVFAGINLSEYGMEDKSEKVVITTTTTPEVKKAIPGTSDVDMNIPTTSMKRENTFCLIIANETYEKAPEVEYASTDGEIFRRYCVSTLGIPNKNVHMLVNANYLQMQEQLNWLKDVSSVYGDDANYIVYYAGHGIPGEDGSCYLLPVEGDPQKVNQGYSLKNLYSNLGSLTTQSALVIIDACFSGTDRNDVSMLDPKVRGALRQVKQEKVGGNVVVLSAASNTETAQPFTEKGHGIFTYYMLKKLQETRGNVTYGDLFDYVHKQVTRNTVVKGKKQTPSIMYSDKLAGTWNKLKL